MKIALKGLGFSSMNCIITLKNAGQMLFLNMCFVAIFFVWYMRYKYTGLTKHFNKQEGYRKKLFFAPFLGMSFRAYIPMSIASFLNILYQLNNPKGYLGENIADFYAFFIFSMVNIFFPFSMLYVALVPQSWLLRPEFK